MNTQRRNELIAVYRDGLLEDTLPFWLPRCVDQEYGGIIRHGAKLCVLPASTPQLVTEIAGLVGEALAAV